MIHCGREESRGSETNKRYEKLQIFSQKINQGDIINTQHKEYGNKYCNNFMWGQFVVSDCGDHFIMYANVSAYNPRVLGSIPGRSPGEGNAIDSSILAQRIP